MPTAKALGNLDLPQPNSNLAGDAVYLSGWALSRSKPIVLIEGLVDKLAAGHTVPDIARPDVALQHPEVLGAASSGFVVEADVSQLEPGIHEVAMRIYLTDGTVQDMGHRFISLAGPMHTARRQTIRHLLVCPFCHTSLSDEPGALVCNACGRRAPLVGDVPVFEGGSQSAPRAPVSSNGYGPKAKQLIEEYRDGLMLDCGAGYPTESYANVVQFDLFRFPSTDVTGDVLHLPFADNSFDAVISQAVMEHVRDPFRYSAELLRVLKLGGKVVVDSAFMQPLHGYPYHYFNTTLTGLQELMKPFEVIEDGVAVHQKPWVTLNWLLSRYVAGLSNERERKKLLNAKVGDIIKQLGTGVPSAPFDALTPEAEQELAAGVYFLGRKSLS